MPRALWPYKTSWARISSWIYQVHWKNLEVHLPSLLKAKVRDQLASEVKTSRDFEDQKPWKKTEIAGSFTWCYQQMSTCWRLRWETWLWKLHSNENHHQRKDENYSTLKIGKKPSIGIIWSKESTNNFR